MSPLGQRTLEQVLEDLAASRRRVAELEAIVEAHATNAGHEEMLETLLEHMPDYVYFKDRDRRFVLASDLFCKLFGRSLDEILGKTDEDLFPPEVAKETIEDDLRVIRTGTSIVCKEEGSDELGWVLTTKVPWRDQAGNVIGLFGISRDITEHKQRAREHREMAEQYRQLAENSPTVTWLTDKSGETSFISPNVQQVYGYRPSEILEQGAALWLDRIHREDRAAVQSAFESIFGEEGRFDIEYRIQHKDGRWIWLHDRANAIVQEGVHRLACGAFTDITERKRAEHDRLALESRLHQAQRLESLGVLASGLAHDFNNLLVAIYANIDLTLRELEPSSAAHARIADARKAADRAGDLVNQMLAYAGNRSSRVEEVDLKELVREMTCLLKPTIAEKTMLVVELEGDALTMCGDPTQLRQILMNLIANAAQAIGDEEGQITVKVAAVDCDSALLRAIQPSEELPEGRYLCLQVADTGHGMSRTTKERIFDPFFTTKPSGSGLGLSAVHGIVCSHGGAIQVDSEPGAGSTFTAWFPAANRAGTALEPDNRSSPCRRGTILVADDDEMVRASAVASVKELGFASLTAANGCEAVDLFRKHRDSIDCVLLDLRMPVMGGEEAFTKLGELADDVRVVLCSGFADDAAARRLTEKGISAILKKPYTIDQLEAVLQSLLAR